MTYGDVVDVAPLKIKFVFSLTGEDVLQLFSELAATGGEGVSHGVKLIISKDKLMKSSLNDKDISPNSTYRIATLDYLAQGNDHLDAFKTEKNVVSPQSEKIMCVIWSWIISANSKPKGLLWIQDWR